MMIRTFSIALVALLLAGGTFAALASLDARRASRVQDEIQAPVNPDELQAPRADLLGRDRQDEIQAPRSWAV